MHCLSEVSHVSFNWFQRGWVVSPRASAVSEPGAGHILPLLGAVDEEEHPHDPRTAQSRTI